MENEADARESDNEAPSLHYSIDIETKNYKLTREERDLLRELVAQLVDEIKSKLQLVLDNPGNAHVDAHISSTVSGRRKLTICI